MLPITVLYSSPGVIKEAMAMTTIKATCPTCGDVDLKPRDINVVVAPAAIAPQKPAKPAEKPAAE